MPPVTAALRPPGALYEMAVQFRQELGSMQQAAVDQALAAHAVVYDRIRDEYDVVLAKIKTAQDAGEELSPSWLYQKQRLSKALATTKVEIARYAAAASETTRQAQASAIAASVKHQAKLVAKAQQQSGPVQQAGISFTEISDDTLQHLVGNLQDGSPVSSLLVSLGPELDANLRRALTEGIALGKSTDWMRARVGKALDVPGWRVERIIRTETQRVYRQAARQSMLANADTLRGWTWTATLDARVCPACLVMDGTEHPLWAILDGHPLCRCAMVPATKGYGELLGPGFEDLDDDGPPVRQGALWLEAQSPETQRAVLGRAKFAAWQDGKITLQDVVGRRSDAQWGTTRYERSLREIRKGQHANYADRQEARAAKVEYVGQGAQAAALADMYTADELATMAQDAQAQEAANLLSARTMQANRQAEPVGPQVRDPAVAAAARTAAKAAAKAERAELAAAKVKAANRAEAATKAKAQAVLATTKTRILDADSEAEAVGALSAALPELLALPDGPSRVRALHALNTLTQRLDGEQASAQAWRAQSHTWAGESPGYRLVIGEDGWGRLEYPVGSPQSITPAQVSALLSDPDSGWTVDLPPEPAVVASLLKLLQNPTKPGYLDVGFAAILQKQADSGKMEAQFNVNALAALDQAKATLLPPPSGNEVNKMLAAMTDAPETAVQGMEALAVSTDPGMDKQHLSNVKAAVATYHAQQNNKATLGVQVRPTADVPAPQGPFGPPPDVSTLSATGQVLGTHGAQVYTGADGSKWLYKPPGNAADTFLTTLDEATSVLQVRTGLPTPATYVVELDGTRGSLQRMFDADPAFPNGFRASALSSADLVAVQQQHVLDWLLSNHDGHADQFLRLADGTLVGIDKGQAFRWAGQDKLDWTFHPNQVYGTDQPVYNKLFGDWAAGHGVQPMDPRYGDVAAYIAQVQAISDAELRELFRPYAIEAAARGRLATPQPNSPGVTKPRIPAQDVEAFLDALVKRKADLDTDMAKLYDRALAQRRKVEPGYKPTKPTPTAADKARAKAKALKGAPKPEPPATPDASADAKGRAAYSRAVKRHAKALLEWREANGVRDEVVGMDRGVLRHGSNDEGSEWANREFNAKRYTPEQREQLESYTGPTFQELNSALRASKGNPKSYSNMIRALDSAMLVQPMPEDVILHRGTEREQFRLAGKRLTGDADLAALVGTVQVDHGYLSTSVGSKSAFQARPVQLVIRVPAGTPGSYVDTFSKFQGEREVILGRGQQFYVHAVYNQGGKYVVEVEIVPAGFIPPTIPGGAVDVRPSAKPWTL